MPDNNDPYFTPDAPSVQKSVRGIGKLQGVQPDLINHWNNLRGEFDAAGITPEIKSGFRTQQQQQALYNNPATRARTKGNDGIVNISPHQRGTALDISFNASQREQGRQIIADYAKRNNLHVPSDEPWHIALPAQSQTPATSDPYFTPDTTAPQSRGAAMADNVSSGMQGSSAPLTSNDAAWHFGMTPEEAKKLTPKALRVLTEAVQEDQRKKAAGEAIAPPPLRYQNDMRKQAGLQPLKFNIATDENKSAPYYGGSTSFSIGEKPQIEVKPRPFTFNQPSDAQIKAGIQAQVANEAAQAQKAAPSRLQGGGAAPPSVDIQAETEKRFRDFQAERAKTLDYARHGSSMQARTPSFSERASAAVNDLLQKYAPGIASIDTPGGLKTDVLRGAISSLNVIPGPQAAILNRVSQQREITPEEKLLNPNAESESNLARGVGQASTAFLPFVGAGKLVSAAGVASPVLRDVLTFGLAEAGKQLSQTGKIDPEALAETMATGGVMGKIAGVDPSLKRRLVAYIAPQLAASVAKGEKPDQILQGATQNALFALAGGHEAKEEAPAQTVPDALQAKLRGGEIDTALAAREAAVKPSLNIPAMRVAVQTQGAQDGNEHSARADAQGEAERNEPFKVIDRRGQNEQQPDLGGNAQQDTNVGARLLRERVDSGDRPSGGQDSAAKSLLPAEEGTPQNRATSTSESALPTQQGETTVAQPPSGTVVERGRMGDVPTEPPRHVDLQPRRQRGDGKGQFKEETKAQRESRLAHVTRPESAIPPQVVPQTAEATPEQPTATDTERLKASANEAWARLQAARGSDNEQQLREEWSQAENAAEMTEARDYFAAGGKYIDATERMRMLHKDTPLEEYRANKNAMRLSAARDRVAAPSEGGVSAPQEALKATVPQTPVEAAPKTSQPSTSIGEAIPKDANLTEASQNGRQVSEPRPIETKPSKERDPYFTPEPSTTSAKKAQVDIERNARGAEPLPWSPKTKSDAELLDSAKKANANNPNDPRRLVDEVLAKPRALSDKETVQVDLRKQELKNEHNQLLTEIDKTSDPETLAIQRARLEAIEKDFDDTDKAWRLSGTEKGRGLRAQQITINQDFDLVSVLGRMKAAKGRELTVDERAKYEGMVRERDQAILDRDAALERAHTVELQRQISKSSRQRARSETKEALDVEAATIKTNIAAEFARLKSAQSSVHSAFGLGSLDPEGVITKELLKYARNRVKANVGLKAEALIDEVHDMVKDFGASRRQVAELLSGYMKPRDTRETDPATKQLADIRKEIKSLLTKEDVAAGKLSARPQGPKTSEARKLPAEGPRLSEGVGKKEGPQLGPKQGPTLREGVGEKEGPSLGEKQGPSKRFVSRNTTRLKQLQSKEADLTLRMAADDYSPKVRPEPLPYNREVNAAQLRVKQIERQFNEEAEKRAPKTIGDYLVRWKKFAVLGFPSTIGKLGSAATGRMAATPLYEIAGEGLRRLPGLQSTFKDVPRATLAGERAAISQLWQSESFKDILRHLKGGDDMISMLYGEGGGDEFVQRSSSGSVVPKNFDELMDRPGHLHAAVKVIPKRAAIFRTFENLLAAEQRKPNGRDVSDPAVQMALMGEAYPEAQRAVLQQKNPMSSLFNRVIHAASTSESRMARGAGKALQFQYPITKVPANFIGETALHIGGLPAGLGEVAIRGASGKVKQLLSERGDVAQKIATKLPDAVSDLKPEERVRIARALKTGGVGLGFVIWGMMRPDQFGGYYQPGKRDPKDVKAGGMRFMGVNIPRWMGHIPPLEAAQFGATLRRVYDSMSEKGKTTTEAIKEAGIAGVKGMGEEIPFIDPLINSAHGVGALVGKEGERTKFLGSEAVAMVPGSLRQVAKTADYPQGGTLTGALNPFGSQEPVSREEKTVGEIVKGGIPVLRQTVPEKNSSGKLMESSGGDDPLAKELMRLDKQVNGASKEQDESQVEFEKRRDVVNPQIATDLKSLVDSREYKRLSDPDKKQQIAMHVSAITKQANENYRLQSGTDKPKLPRQIYIAPQPTPRTVAP